MQSEHPLQRLVLTTIVPVGLLIIYCFYLTVQDGIYFYCLQDNQQGHSFLINQNVTDCNSLYDKNSVYRQAFPKQWQQDC